MAATYRTASILFFFMDHGIAVGWFGARGGCAHNRWTGHNVMTVFFADLTVHLRIVACH
jgi:hypothetical protein